MVVPLNSYRRKPADMDSPDGKKTGKDLIIATTPIFLLTRPADIALSSQDGRAPSPSSRLTGRTARKRGHADGHAQRGLKLSAQLRTGEAVASKD